MKKIIFLLFTFFDVFVYQSFAQSISPSITQADSSIKTEVFWIDLCTPGERTSVIHSGGRSKKFEISWKHNLAFGIRNINQYKFDYTINSIPFSAFVDTNYNFKSNSLNAQFNSSINNFYQLQQYQNSFQNKKAIAHYLNSLDSIKTLNDTMFRRMDDAYYIIDNTKGNTAKDKAIKDKQQQKINQYSRNVKDNYANYDRIAQKLKDIAVLFDIKEQARALKGILNKLSDIESNCKKVNMIWNDSQSIYQLQNSIDTFLNPKQFRKASSKYSNMISSDLKVNYNDPYSITNANINKIGTFYYQATIITSHCLDKFQLLYDSLDNVLSHIQCLNNIYSLGEDKGTILRKTAIFNDVHEAFLDLKNFYTYYEMDIPYLSYFNVQMDNLQQALFKNFTNISKILTFKDIYIVPSSSNMNNVDQINITLNITDRNTNKSQSYDYDIFLKGGLKFDFSAGFFGTALKNNTYTSTFILDSQNKPTDNKVIRSVNNGSMDVGFGAMVNITLRPGASWLAPGVSFGLNLSTQPSFQFLSAATLSIGKRERILIHAGLASGFVKRIDGLELNTSLPSEKVGDVVPTVDRFLIKPFVGITYNLSKNNVFKVTSFKTTSSTTQEK